MFTELLLSPSAPFPIPFPPAEAHRAGLPLTHGACFFLSSRALKPPGEFCSGQTRGVSSACCEAKQHGSSSAVLQTFPETPVHGIARPQGTECSSTATLG